jgi:hypothetical protein
MRGKKLTPLAANTAAITPHTGSRQSLKKKAKFQRIRIVICVILQKGVLTICVVRCILLKNARRAAA